MLMENIVYLLIALFEGLSLIIFSLPLQVWKAMRSIRSRKSCPEILSHPSNGRISNRASIVQGTYKNDVCCYFL